MRIKDSGIVLTGASSGIGKDLLKMLLHEGARVYAVSREIEDTLTFAHKRLTTKNLDVSSEASLELLFQEAEEELGRIDAFIANAGFSYHEFLEEADWQHIVDIYETNVHSVIYSAIKMRELYADSPFHFMATLSAMSFLSLPGNALYSSTKAALRGFFDGFEQELLRKDQILQRVYPVATETEFFTRSGQIRKPPPVQSSYHVARRMLAGLKKDRRHIYPSKLFKYTWKFTPFFYRLYLARERKFFFESLTKDT